MTVHVLIPVFNRIEMTQAILEHLRVQDLDEAVTITVIDDGSTDGTAEFLRKQQDVRTLTGDGNLWWGGAINLGLRVIQPAAQKTDWILFLNNDTSIGRDFIQQLLDAARLYAPAVVGSVVRHEEWPHRLLSVGPQIDPWRFVVEDVSDAPEDIDGVVAVDAVSGRGVIYPVMALRVVGGMRPRWLPQYLGDYEVSLRVRARGWRLLVAGNAVVYSSSEFGSAYQPRSLFERLFSVRSPTYLPAQVAFWWQASGLIERITLPFRLVVHFIWRLLGRR